MAKPRKKSVVTKKPAKPRKISAAFMALDSDPTDEVTPEASPTAASDAPTEPPAMVDDAGGGAVTDAVAETPAPGKRASGLDAAARLLRESGEPMSCGQLVETMLARGLWHTEGKTPSATIYAAILREINTRGESSRFKKTQRGRFAANG